VLQDIKWVVVETKLDFANEKLTNITIWCNQ